MKELEVKRSLKEWTNLVVRLEFCTLFGRRLGVIVGHLRNIDGDYKVQTSCGWAEFTMEDCSSIGFDTNGVRVIRLH